MALVTTTEVLPDTDPDVAAIAAYFLALHDKPDGLQKLIEKYKSAPNTTARPWYKLTYRAIARLNNDSQVPVLERMFKNEVQESYNASEFYWTIRSMDGPQALKLRKHIRDTVGMSELQ